MDSLGPPAAAGDDRGLPRRPWPWRVRTPRKALGNCTERRPPAVARTSIPRALLGVARTLFAS
eukprot:4350082-Pyramimonas_sp.AAC.1